MTLTIVKLNDNWICQKGFRTVSGAEWIEQGSSLIEDALSIHYANCVFLGSCGKSEVISNHTNNRRKVPIDEISQIFWIWIFKKWSIGQGQVAHDGSSHAAASGPASRPQSHGPAKGTSAASDNNIFSHCIIAEENNSFHNWDAGLQFLSDKEIPGSSLNFVISLLLRRCLWARIAQNSRVAWKKS